MNDREVIHKLGKVHIVDDQEDIEDKVVMDDFIRALSKKNKVILGLWLLGYTHEQIANLTGHPRGTIIHYLRYILKDLTRFYREGKHSLYYYQQDDFLDETEGLI
jgi:DNA-directed RNA polymerase specialized sigma24 family protein